MNSPIISIKNISKKYDITHQRGGYVALRDVITNAAKEPIKFAKHKAKKILGREIKEEFWALQNINIDIKKGDTVGIIGSNGAGKSTLLKILSQITFPTTGEIEINGRVASLLEIGTGFHPELTGRENIFLNGAIIGMGKKEIIQKFDEIVEFAEIQQFIDTPVKRYSSGMYVRLAFSVAAHMEPDILLIDEVLAVGDTKFQKKCLGKMDAVTTEAGRTILFVSHNMSTVQKLCNKVILLEHGQVKMYDDTHKVIDTYLNNNFLTENNDNLKTRKDRKGKGGVRLTSFFVENKDGKKVRSLKTGEFYTFCFGYESTNKKELKNMAAAMFINLENGTGLIINHTNLTNQDFETAPPKGIIRCKLKQKLPLSDGIYNISAALNINNEQEDSILNAGIIDVTPGNFFKGGKYIKHNPIFIDHTWSLN